MNPANQYLEHARKLVENVQAQIPAIAQAADWFSASILAGRMVHVFGSGHSRIMVEEMWPRYGSFPGFTPIVELSLTFHNPVVGANGQRQAMFLENVSGLAERILRNFKLSAQDSAAWPPRAHWRERRCVSPWWTLATTIYSSHSCTKWRPGRSRRPRSPRRFGQC